MCRFEDDLFRYEMATYGVGYWEDDEALFVGARFVKHPEHTEFVLQQHYGSEALDLLYAAEGEGLVGARFGSVLELIAYYANGLVPDPCPMHFFADLADSYLTELIREIEDPDEEALAAALRVHAKIRELIGEDELPAVIRERILKTYDYKRLSIN